MHDDYDHEDGWGEPLSEDENMPHVGVLSYRSFEEARVAVGELLEELRLTFSETDREYGLSGVEFSANNVQVDITVDSELDCRIVFTPRVDGELLDKYSVGRDQSIIVLERDKYGLAALAHMRDMFEYLLDDVGSYASEVNFSQLEQVFGEGERTLDIMNREGMPLELPFAGSGDW